MSKHVSHSPDETRQLALVLAEQFLKKHAGEPLVIALEGELGAGKTTFTQAFAQALGAQGNIKSPTFVLMKLYQIHNSPGYEVLYHLDCYRLQDAKELGPLDVESILKKEANIILIEWAERVKEILPAKHVTIKFHHLDENTREISID